MIDMQVVFQNFLTVGVIVFIGYIIWNKFNGIETKHALINLKEKFGKIPLSKLRK